MATAGDREHNHVRRVAVRQLAARGVSSYSATHFLIVLGLLLIATPIIDRPPLGDKLEAIAFTLVILTGTLAVRSRRRALVASIVLGGAMLIGTWVDQIWPDLLWPPLPPILGAAFSAFIAAQMLVHILKAREVRRETVCAGLATYLMIGIAWMFAYQVVANITPKAFAEFGQPIDNFTGLRAYYFSYITLTTTGYGDITPLANTARMLAVLEAIAGTFFVITVLARLVSAYTRPTGSPQNGDAA